MISLFFLSWDSVWFIQRKIAAQIYFQENMYPLIRKYDLNGYRKELKEEKME